MKCEYHKNCDKPVTARIGLPNQNAMWACRDAFQEWRSKYEKPESKSKIHVPGK